MSTIPGPIYSIRLEQNGQRIRGLARKPIMEAAQAAFSQGRPFALRMNTGRGYVLCSIMPTVGAAVLDVQIVKGSDGTVYDGIPVGADGQPSDEPTAVADPGDHPALFLDYVALPWHDRVAEAMGLPSADAKADAIKAPGEGTAKPSAEDMPTVAKT